MGRDKPFLSGLRRRAASALQRVAGGIEPPKPHTKNFESTSIRNYVPEGKAIVLQVSPGHAAFKVYKDGEEDFDAGRVLDDEVKQELSGEQYKSLVDENSTFCFIDPDLAGYAMEHGPDKDSRYLLGERFTKTIVDRVADFAQRYGFEVKVIGAEKMKKVKIPEANQVPQRPVSAQGATSASGVDHEI